MLLNVVDMPFVFLTIYSVIRNQYFYLGETVLIEVPAAANFVVSTFVIVEMGPPARHARTFSPASGAVPGGQLSRRDVAAGHS